MIKDIKTLYNGSSLEKKHAFIMIIKTTKITIKTCLNLYKVQAMD